MSHDSRRLYRDRELEQLERNGVLLWLTCRWFFIFCGTSNGVNEMDEWWVWRRGCQISRQRAELTNGLNCRRHIIHMGISVVIQIWLLQPSAFPLKITTLIAVELFFFLYPLRLHFDSRKHSLCGCFFTFLIAIRLLFDLYHESPDGLFRTSKASICCLIKTRARHVLCTFFPFCKTRSIRN